MNRDEFKQHALVIYNNSSIGQSIIDDGEPFWIPEYREGWQASVFIVTKCMRHQYKPDNTFWSWCRNNLTKMPLCFMSDIDNNIEWWGFNTEHDASLFLMKWV